MTEHHFYPADRWEKEAAALKQEIAFLKRYMETADNHIEYLMTTMETLHEAKEHAEYMYMDLYIGFNMKRWTRHYKILLQLGYDYLSFLELFEDDSTKERTAQVESILARIEKEYGVLSRPQTEPQPKDTEEEGEEPIHPSDYLNDL